MSIPQEFTELLPKISNEGSDDPIYCLWVYDPQEDKVHVEHNEGRHRAEAIDHGQLAERVPHPGRVHGYAYRIRGGYRITDWDHRPVADPHIKEAVLDELRGTTKGNRSHQGSLIQLRAVS